MQIVRARFDLEVRDRRLAAVILRGNGAGLQLEFADRLRRRTELVVVAAGQDPRVRLEFLRSEFRANTAGRR